MARKKRAPLTDIGERSGLDRATEALKRRDLEMSGCTEIQDLGPGLFFCGKDASGNPFAKLGIALERRAFELTISAPWKTGPLTRLLSEAMQLPDFGAPHDGAFARLFKSLHHAKSKDERERRAKEAKEILCAIVDDLAGTDQAKPHGSKAIALMAGHDKPVPLAYAAIEHARQLVEAHQRLPTKIELQRNLEDAYPKPVWNPKTGEWKEKTGTWTEVWKEAGIDSLEDGKYGTGNVPLGSR